MQPRKESFSSLIQASDVPKDEKTRISPLRTSKRLCGFANSMFQASGDLCGKKSNWTEAARNRSELLEDWKLCDQHQSPKKIPPLE